MQYIPAAIDQATHTAVTARITAHVKRGLAPPDDTPCPGPRPILLRRRRPTRTPATNTDPAPSLPRINREMEHRHLPRQRRALHRGRTTHILRTQDRHPRRRHRPHLHPLRRTQHPTLTTRARRQTAKLKSVQVGNPFRARLFTRVTTGPQTSGHSPGAHLQSKRGARPDAVPLGVRGPADPAGGARHG
jgi:hypothetical protein